MCLVTTSLLLLISLDIVDMDPIFLKASLSLFSTVSYVRSMWLNSIEIKANGIMEGKLGRSSRFRKILHRY